MGLNVILLYFGYGQICVLRPESKIKPYESGVATVSYFKTHYLDANWTSYNVEYTFEDGRILKSKLYYCDQLSFVFTKVLRSEFVASFGEFIFHGHGQISSVLQESL